MCGICCVMLNCYVHIALYGILHLFHPRLVQWAWYHLFTLLNMRFYIVMLLPEAIMGQLLVDFS